MFEYKKYFDEYCNIEGIDLRLSFDMPYGYESANGTFDVATKTVYINAKKLHKAADYEKLFFLFHELRHSAQYLLPIKFDNTITRSIQYVIMYDGTCYKMINGKYYECKLEGGKDYFTDIYLGQPYEVDANRYAYEQVKRICGNSDKLFKLYEFLMPSQPVSYDIYASVYALIDEKIQIKN